MQGHVPHTRESRPLEVWSGEGGPRPPTPPRPLIARRVLEGGGPKAPSTAPSTEEGVPSHAPDASGAIRVGVPLEGGVPRTPPTEGQEYPADCQREHPWGH